MQPGFMQYEHFLRTVLKHKKENISELLKAVNSKVVKSLIEIAYNLLKGSIPLNPKQINYFKKEKKIIKTLINRKNSINKNVLILQENPVLVKRMLNLVFKR